ncbi:hypothetical protein DFH28DRAFT_903918, partial [Melampsora americana]
DAHAKPLVKIRLAKGKLFGGTSSVIEHRRRPGNSRGQQSTNVQKKMNNLHTLKQAQLQQKHATYVRLTCEYNDHFTPGTLLATSSLQEVEGMELGDPFLNFEGLIYYNEPWAVDNSTQEVIQAYIDVCQCTEEL